MTTKHTTLRASLSFTISLLFLLLMNIKTTGQYVFKGQVIDTISEQPLGFAAISKSGSSLGTITNIDGQFAFKSTECPLQVDISFLGYKSKTIILDTEDIERFKTIRLEKTSFLVPDITIYHNDYILDLIRKARKVNQKHLRQVKQGKSFFRFYSFIDEQPIEFYEGFYNIRTSVNGISDIQFKSGQQRFAQVPNQANGYFSTTFLAPIVKMVSLFGRENELVKFPNMPFHFTSKRKLKEAFDFKYESAQYTKDGITIIDFESKLDPYFSGQIVLDKHLEIQQATYRKTFTPREKKPIEAKGRGAVVDTMKMVYHLFYDKVDGALVLNHSTVDYHYCFENYNKDTFEVSTTVMNSNFDYDNSFNLPDMPEEYQGHLPDIMLCDLSPFFDDIYQNENVIEQTEKEQILDKHFDRVGSVSKNIWLPLLEFEPWHPGYKINKQKIKRTALLHSTEVLIEERDAPLVAKHIICSFPFSDYICYNNKPKFTSNIIIDYQLSYCSLPLSDSLLNVHFENQLHLARLYSKRAELELSEAFADRCPDPEQIEIIERKHFQDYLEEKRFYKGQALMFGELPDRDERFLNEHNYGKVLFGILGK